MRQLIICTTFFFIQCSGQIESNGYKTEKLVENETTTKTNKKEKILWRKDVYDLGYKDTINVIILNNKAIQNLTEPERAAIGYVATFVGNECHWKNGKANKDRSNLECKLISALNLGCQCSETHLNFLTAWFKEEPSALERLDNCPIVPFTANSQNTFETLNLETIGDTIEIDYQVSGVNLRALDSWEWSEEIKFLVKNDHLKILSTKKSEVIHTQM